MKNKKIVLLLLLMVLIFPLSGCTSYLKADKKVVQNPETGQNLVKNILCQPEDEATLKIYNDHIDQVDVSKLPTCSQFGILSGGYEGIWATIFVKPLAFVIIKIGEFVGNYGISVILVTILIRLVMVPLTKKTAMQSENMKLAQSDLQKLESKYRNRNDQQAQMQKSQEMLAIYKKFNISPLSGCIFSLIQVPLFFAFYESMNRLPAIFEESFLGFQLGTSPITAILKGHFLYVIFIILVIAVTFFSFKLNKTAAMGSDQQKQMNLMTNISIVMISIASFTISTGIALYWIFNSGFTVVQNLIVKWRKKEKKA